MTAKQLEYIQYLELAYAEIDNRKVYGCCAAILNAAYEIQGPNWFQAVGELKKLLADTFKPDDYSAFYWPTNKEGGQRRLIALSFLINIIETEDLFK